jgi:hypothetical protein
MAPMRTILTRRRAELASPPAWIKPQLAKLVEKAPDGPDWLHEIKFDGYRVHARLDAGRVQILTRRGNDWTDKYQAIARSIAVLPAQNAYAPHPSQPRHFAVKMAVRVGYGPIAPKAEPIEETKEPGIILAGTRSPATSESPRHDFAV